MSPRVNPDMIPAKRTRMHETPAYVNHQKVPNSMFSASASRSPDETERRAMASADIAIIVVVTILSIYPSIPVRSQIEDQLGELEIHRSIEARKIRDS